MKFYVYTDYMYSFTSDVEIRDGGIYFPNEDVFVSFNRWPRNMSPDGVFVEELKFHKEVPDTYTMKYRLNGVERSFEAIIDQTYTFLPVSMTLEEPTGGTLIDIRNEFSFLIRRSID
jgi:hypothetical protein